uniref:Uncharacterized protein n=1 Tax=Oryza rufipogon TaxID=4529 RepID=A0A0E0NCK2_ORYRU
MLRVRVEERKAKQSYSLLPSARIQGWCEESQADESRGWDGVAQLWSKPIACVEKKRDGDHVFVESSHPLLVPDEDILHYYPLAKTLKSGGDRVSL